MANSDEYEITLLDNEKDARLCAKLTAEEFVLNNPLTIFNQATAEDLLEKWLLPFIVDGFHQKLSFFIRHRPTNEIVAAIMASDLYSYFEKHSHDALSPSSQDPTADLFSELMQEFVHDEFKQELKTNMVLYIVAGVTHSKYTGKNLATKLRIHLCNYARDIKGFQYAFIQTMNPATRHIYVKKMNGKEMKIVDLATWQWKKKGDDSSYPFKHYHNEPAVNILIDFNERK
ncbi:unnamed protein product [Rotaria sp. Silwood2]|nr:unnamed protein product [Rotaria sp. Silwood2]CAF3315000.1 unnamed protein product [Rotaria sp. Silwood2]CAF4392847.1 unnamed protein product [Rotaria sp. Silwood2]